MEIKKNWKQNKICKFAGIVIGIIILIYVVETFQYKGLVGLLTFIFLFACYKIYVYRDNFIQGIRTIEGMIWDKPLNKELWAKGELKNTKVKIVWRKKNEK